jgi:hypothetical protein
LSAVFHRNNAEMAATRGLDDIKEEDFDRTIAVVGADARKREP